MMVPSLTSKTRVCIKNLPPRITEHDLKEFLLKEEKRRTDEDISQRSIPVLQITDCKILKNVQGKSRKIAFVGFRQPEQARHVIETFDRTFLNMSRITVEAATAKRKNQDEKSHTPDNFIYNNNDSKIHDDPTQHDKKVANAKEEFLNVMGAGSKKTKFWSNDTAEGEGREALDPETKTTTNFKNNDDSGECEEKSTIDDKDPQSNNETKFKNVIISDMDFLRSKAKKVEELDDGSDDDSKDSISTGSSCSSSSSSSDSSSSLNNSAEENHDNEDDKNRIKNHSDGKKEVDDSSLSEHPPKSPDQNHTDIQDNNDSNTTVTSKNRLFVRNLPFETSEDGKYQFCYCSGTKHKRERLAIFPTFLFQSSELFAQFSTFGRVLECHIPVDDQKRNKGYAFISFESTIDANEATNQLDKTDFQGRLLHILPARPPPQENNIGGNLENMTWKQKQELARKEKEANGLAANKASTGWSASFVRGDAVVDNLAERLGLRKGEILGVKDKLSSGDAAVRLALGETQIIEENREYFRQHNVDMDALVSVEQNGETSSDSNKRSNTSILVKNLPFDTRLEELAKLFHVSQEPMKILLPPSRTIAMIEYEHSNDAKKAFRKLIYRRFKHVPIYLEWAPLQAKKTDSNTSSRKLKSDGDAIAVNTSGINQAATNNNNNIVVNPRDNEHDVTTDNGSSALYIKNLNFETTEKILQDIFEKQMGKCILSVRIPQKVSPSNHSLSMGYGFVELESHLLAKKSMKLLQGRLVDGHNLHIALSSSKELNSSRAKTATSEKPPTKIIVRNLSFQATRKDLLKLFATFGQLKKIRLPKKFDGGHRGFAFVEFLTSKEASIAMNALSRTHLYGRRLVLEWAIEETDNDQGKNINRLREKAKRDAADAAAVNVDQYRKSKKIRFD